MTLKFIQILKIWPLSIVSIIFVPSVFFVWLPHKILSSSQGWYSSFFNLGIFRFTGLLPLILGFGVFIWCVLSFAVVGKGTPSPVLPPKMLVISGLYRYVRNPMYNRMAAFRKKTVW